MAAEDLLQLQVAHCFHLVEFERCWKKKKQNFKKLKEKIANKRWFLKTKVGCDLYKKSSKDFSTKRRHLEAPLSFLGKDTFLPSLNLRSMLKWSFAHMFFSNDFFIRYNGDCHDRTSLWSSEWTWTLWVKMTRGFYYGFYITKSVIGHHKIGTWRSFNVIALATSFKKCTNNSKPLLLSSAFLLLHTFKGLEGVYFKALRCKERGTKYGFVGVVAGGSKNKSPLFIFPLQEVGVGFTIFSES